MANALTKIKADALTADLIDETKLADNSIDSEHYNDGSIDNAHIADDAIDSEHYAAGSIDNEHLANNAVDTDEIADDAVTLAKMDALARGKLIVGDSSGNPSALAAGSDNYVLTMDSNGDAGWEAAAAGGEILQVATVQSTTSLTATDSSFTHWSQLDRAFTPTASDSTLFIVTALGHVRAKGSDDPITYVALTSNDNSSRLWEGTVASQASGGSVSNTELDASYTNVWTEGAGSTSERTYKIYYKLGRGSQLMINGNSGTSSSLTVIEVAA